MNTKFIAARLPALLLFLICAPALPYCQLDPATAVSEMARGINLGNTLEPPTEGDWNNGPAQERYFDAYRAAGFSNVRIPVRWDRHTSDEAPFTIDAAWLDRVEQVVDWGLERGLYVTLNAHHDDWLKQGYEDPQTRARFDSIWVQVATRFRNKSEQLLFEIINEPFGMTVEQVDDLNARILKIIRRTNPTRLVVIGGSNYAGAQDLLNMAVPDDPYLIGYFHSYDPYLFGLEGRGTWGSEQDYQQLENQFARVADWSQEHELPIYLSEFGAVRQADYNSRMRHYAAFVKACLRHGFAFSAWDDGGMFRILDREDNSWPEIKDVLLHTYLDSPTDVVTTTAETLDSSNLYIDLAWTDPVDGRPVTVERATGEGDFSPVVTLPAGTDRYRDTQDLRIGNFYTYRLSTERADGTVVQSYPSRLLLPGKQNAFGRIDLPGVLQAEDYDLGGEGVAYHDADSENQGGAYRIEEGVDIGSTDAGGYAVGYIASGEWLEYTVEVEQAGVFELVASVATEQGGGQMVVSVPETGVQTVVDIPTAGTGGWNLFESVAADGLLSLAAGEQLLRIDFTGSQAFNLDFLTFTAATVDSNVVINYFDGLDTAANRFVSESDGISISVAEGVFSIAGNGTSGQYANIRYNLPDGLIADVANSGSRLYVGASTASGDPVNLRIDLVDENNYATTVAGKTITVQGSIFTEYLLDYSGTYQDGGYGGTGCTDDLKPCRVNGNRIVALVFYPEAGRGKLSDTIRIDYLSFGKPYGGGAVSEPGIVNFRDDLTGAEEAFTGTPTGLDYGVDDGVFFITGQGDAPPYQTVQYRLRGEDGDPVAADVVNSGDLLFIRARLRPGAGSAKVAADTVNLRIDLADENNFHTTLAGRSIDITGDSFSVYSISYAGGYQDGGYGGTACTEATRPCPVDGQRIERMIFYPEAASGKFAGTLEIDWISFGVDLSTSVRDPAELRSLRVFPNPTSDQIHLTYELVTGETVAVELINSLGQRVLHRQYGFQQRGANQLSIPLPPLQSGSYFVRLHLGRQASRAYPVSVR